MRVLHVILAASALSLTPSFLHAADGRSTADGNMQRVRMSTQPFVNWLDTADEEDSDDEESDDGDQ